MQEQYTKFTFFSLLSLFFFGELLLDKGLFPCLLQCWHPSLRNIWGSRKWLSSKLRGKPVLNSSLEIKKESRIGEVSRIRTIQTTAGVGAELLCTSAPCLLLQTRRAASDSDSWLSCAAGGGGWSGLQEPCRRGLLRDPQLLPSVPFPTMVNSPRSSADKIFLRFW